MKIGDGGRPVGKKIAKRFLGRSQPFRTSDDGQDPPCSTE